MDPSGWLWTYWSHSSASIRSDTVRWASRAADGDAANIDGSERIGQRQRVAAVRSQFESRLGDKLLHGVEAEVTQETTQPCFRGLEVAVMAEPAEAAGVQTRLKRIDLPRMQIEDRGPALCFVHSIHAPAGPPI